MDIRPPRIPTILNKFDIWCIRQLQHILTEDASIEYLNTYDNYLNGCATLDEVKSARSKVYSFEWEILYAVIGCAIFNPIPPYYKYSWMAKMRDAHDEYTKSGKVPQLYLAIANELKNPK